MKYAIVIPDGAADLAIPSLGGRTALEAAKTPTLDRLATSGELGRAKTTPAGFGAGSDVCTMSLMGYDPARFHTGRAPLEAAAIGIDIGQGETVFRVNLVTTSPDGTMLDHSVGGISDDEAKRLFDALSQAWGSPHALTHGVSYRGILKETGQSFAQVNATPPHEIPGEPWREHMPTGQGSDLLNELMNASIDVLRDHDVNKRRRERGQREASMAWIWGGGTRPDMTPFAERFGLRGSMITAVDLLRGLARLIGWDVLDVPGLTSYHDNDYEGQGQAAASAIDDFDLVCCHVEAPDEASHQGDAPTKVAAIEAIDRHVLAPIVERLEREAGGWRLLVLPDHYTLVSTRKHDATPVPFLIAGSNAKPGGGERFTEFEAERVGGVPIEGHDLMARFLGRPGQTPG